MSYYVDLSKYVYMNNGSIPAVNVGWIDEGIKFSKGEVSHKFIMSLWEYIKYPVNQTRGIFENIVLDGRHKIFVAKYQGYSITLGSSEIRVLDLKKNIVYAAPNLILHYILNHKYLPPKCFVDAVIYGPKPNSEKYSKMMVKIYKNGEINGSFSKCKYCNERKVTLGHRHLRKYNEGDKLKITNYEDNVIEDFLYDNYTYDIICGKCGKIFEE